MRAHRRGQAGVVGHARIKKGRIVPVAGGLRKGESALQAVKCPFFHFAQGALWHMDSKAVWRRLPALVIVAGPV